MIQSGMVNFHADLEPLLRPIDSVKQHENNYNQGDVDLIQDSIQVSGMYRPIYVRAATGQIIAGNHTWLACKQMGAEQIPVVELDVDEITAYRLMVADNEIARKARRDDGMLTAILKHLQENDSLLGTGLNEAEYLALLAKNNEPLSFRSGGMEDFTMWPTLCFQVHPDIQERYLHLTDAAGSPNERFKLLLELAERS